MGPDLLGINIQQVDWVLSHPTCVCLSSYLFVFRYFGPKKVWFPSNILEMFFPVSFLKIELMLFML